MKTFREMLDTMSDVELGRTCRDRYQRLMDAHAMGLTDTHPAAAWNADNKTLRDHRVAKDTDDPGNTGSSKEIEREDHHSSANEALDDPNPTGANSPRAPERNGSALEQQLRRRPDLDVNATANDAALRAAIPGLDRVGLPGRDGRSRVLDDDNIVQSPPRSW